MFLPNELIKRMSQELPREINMLIWEFDDTYKKKYSEFIKKNIWKFPGIYLSIALGKIYKNSFNTIFGNYKFKGIKDEDKNELECLRKRVSENELRCIFWNVLTNYSTERINVNYLVFNYDIDVEIVKHPRKKETLNFVFKHKFNGDIKKMNFYIITSESYKYDRKSHFTIDKVKYIWKWNCFNVFSLDGCINIFFPKHIQYINL